LELNVESKVCVVGRSSLPLSVRVTTGTGGPVADAEVLVRWTRTRPPKRRSSPSEYGSGRQRGGRRPNNNYPVVVSGAVTLVTGADGVAERSLDLEAELLAASSLSSSSSDDPPPPLEAGDYVRIEAVWAGPTGEYVTKSVPELAVVESEWTLTVEIADWTTEEEDQDPLPGFYFGVKVGATDANSGGEEMMDASVEVTLERWVDDDDDDDDDEKEKEKEGGNDDDDAKGDRQVVAHCDATADGRTTVQCRDVLKLPTADRYVLRARVVDPNGVVVVESNPPLVLGKTPEEWIANPLRNFAGATTSIRTDKGEEYRSGEDVVLAFVNPFENARLLMTWGNVDAGYRRRVAAAPSGRVEQTVSTAGIEGGCAVNAFLFVPRQTKLALPVEVPVSKSWDYESPRSIRFSRYIAMIDDDRTLRADIRPDAEAAGPGDDVVLTVSVTDPSTGRPVRDAEVAIFAVDEAYLQIQPHPLVRTNETFRIRVPAPLSSADTVDRLFTAKGYREAVDAAYRRYQADPWVYPSRTICCESDEDDEDYLRRHSTWLTEAGAGMGYGYGGGVGGDTMMMKAAPMMAMAEMAMDEGEDEEDEDESVESFRSAGPQPMARSGDGGRPVSTSVASTSGAAAANIAPLRTNFEVTPLFKGHIVTGDDGLAKATFKLPDTLGTYSLRAYAVDRHHRFGSGEGTLRSVKSLNLQPMLPRVIRTGDTFVAGVTVELHDTCLDVRGGNGDDGDDGVEVTIIARSRNAAVAVNETKTATLNGSGPHRVEFDMKAASIGDGVVDFRASAAACGSDALEGTFPVLPLQDEVVVATSMAISGGGGSGDADGDEAGYSPFVWEEGIEFPRASPGSGKLVLSAGVGHLPSLEAFAGTIDRYEYAGDYLSALGLSAAMSPYHQKGDHQKGGGKGVTELNSLLFGKFDLFESGLNSLTDDDLGLQWRKSGCLPRGRSCDDRRVVDAHLNANALLVAKRLDEEGGAKRKLSTSLARTWADALTKELERRAGESRARGYDFDEWDLLARSYLALGFGFTKDADLTVDALMDNRGRMSDTGRLLLAHYLSENSDGANGGAAIVKDVLDGTYNSLRIQGRTAYASYGGGRQSAMPLEAQGLALSLFMTDLDAYEHDLLVEKLANWVGRGNAQDGRTCRSFGYADMLFGAFGLANYDTAKKSAADPDLLLEVHSGEETVLTARFDGRSDNAPVTATKKWSDLPVVPGEGKPEGLVFSGAGTGEASVAVELRFVPDRLATDPVYRGIFVDKVMRRVDPISGRATGAPIQIVQSGSLVEVTIQMTTADDLGYVTLVDFLPAGLEPIDKNLPAGRTGGAERGARGWWYYNPFDNPETRPDQVRWMAVWVASGTHSASYRAVAVTQGIYAVSPAKAFANEQPELMGLSWAGSLVVTASEAPATIEGVNDLLEAKGVKQNARLVLAKDCPEDCGLGEECNIATGLCEVPPLMAPLFSEVGNVDVAAADSNIWLLIVSAALMVLVLMALGRQCAIAYCAKAPSVKYEEVEMKEV